MVQEIEIMLSAAALFGALIATAFTFYTRSKFVRGPLKKYVNWTTIGLVFLSVNMIGQTIMVILDWDITIGRAMRFPYYAVSILMAWFFFAGAIELEKRANEFGFEQDMEIMDSLMEDGDEVEEDPAED